MESGGLRRAEAAEARGARDLATGYFSIQQVALKGNARCFERNVGFSATSTSINHYSNMNCLADPSGWIIWVPSAQFSVLCSFDLTHWPFDTQTCELRFGSWSHHGEEIDITLLSNGSDTNVKKRETEENILGFTRFCRCP